MKSTELTSPENLAMLKEKRAAKLKRTPPKKATKQKSATATAPPAKRAKKTKANKTPAVEKSPSSASEDDDFCIICIKKMPRKLTPANSIACTLCKREVHLKCATITDSCYVCKHCDSEYEEEEE